MSIWMFPKIVGFPLKSSILIGCSIINHPFWSNPIVGNTRILPSKNSQSFWKKKTGPFDFHTTSKKTPTSFTANSSAFAPLANLPWFFYSTSPRGWMPAMPLGHDPAHLFGRQVLGRSRHGLAHRLEGLAVGGRVLWKNPMGFRVRFTGIRPEWSSLKLLQMLLKLFIS